MDFRGYSDKEGGWYNGIGYLLAAVAGAAGGYLCLVLAANLEDWQFYSLRSFVTGKTVMSEIVEHPADCWIVPVLTVALVLGGATIGLLIAKWLRRSQRST